MRSSIFLLFSLFSLCTAHAQNGSSGKTDSVSGNDKGTPSPANTDTSRFIVVPYESAFPGGIAAWNQFLISHFNYPKEAVKENIQGTVIVQFIVEKDGSVTNIRAISGPKELRAAAENIIRQSPRWSPAMKDGRKLKSYKKQPLVFKLED